VREPLLLAKAGAFPRLLVRRHPRIHRCRIHAAIASSGRNEEPTQPQPQLTVQSDRHHSSASAVSDTSAKRSFASAGAARSATRTPEQIGHGSSIDDTGFDAVP
jgi:hypothetical protein